MNSRGHQRSRAGHPAHSKALCAHGRATNTTAYLSRCPVVPASGKGGVPPLPESTKLSRGVLHQRGHARHAAQKAAPSRCGSAYRAPPLDLVRQSVVSVSAESGVPLSPSSTMPRLAGASPPAASLRGLDAPKPQRGHVGPPVAALGVNPTSPLDPVRCSVGLVSGHGGLPPCPGTTKLSRGVLSGVALARFGTHCVALRVYIGCCFVKWSPVAALKLRLVSSTASPPHGFTKPTLCKVPPLGAVARPSALPGRIRALRAAVWRPCGCRGGVASVRRCARRSVQCPAASHVGGAPAHPGGLPLRGFGPARGCPSAPQGGSLSPRKCANVFRPSIPNQENTQHE
jgi:hypothetical protein